MHVLHGSLHGSPGLERQDCYWQCCPSWSTGSWQCMCFMAHRVLKDNIVIDNVCASWSIRSRKTTFLLTTYVLHGVTGLERQHCYWQCIFCMEHRIVKDYIVIDNVCASWITGSWKATLLLTTYVLHGSPGFERQHCYWQCMCFMEHRVLKEHTVIEHVRAS